MLKAAAPGWSWEWHSHSVPFAACGLSCLLDSPEEVFDSLNVMWDPRRLYRVARKLLSYGLPARPCVTKPSSRSRLRDTVTAGERETKKVRRTVRYVG